MFNNNNEWNKLRNKKHYIYRYFNTRTNTQRYKVSILEHTEMKAVMPIYLEMIDNWYWKTLRREGVQPSELRLELIEEFANEDLANEYFETLNTPQETPVIIERKSGYKTNRTIGQYTLDGDLINTFKGANQASAILGIKTGLIYKCCDGQAKTAKGCVFKYEE